MAARRLPRPAKRCQEKVDRRPQRSLLSSGDALKAAAYPLVRHANRALNLMERGLRFARRGAGTVLSAAAVGEPLAALLNTYTP